MINCPVSAKIRELGYVWRFYGIVHSKVYWEQYSLTAAGAKDPRHLVIKVLVPIKDLEGKNGQTEAPLSPRKTLLLKRLVSSTL